MIGDRMDTDVVAGMEAGLHTILVLSGISTPRDDIARFPFRPQPRGGLDGRPRGPGPAVSRRRAASRPGARARPTRRPGDRTGGAHPAGCRSSTARGRCSSCRSLVGVVHAGPRPWHAPARGDVAGGLPRVLRRRALLLKARGRARYRPPGAGVRRGGSGARGSARWRSGRRWRGGPSPTPRCWPWRSSAAWRRAERSWLERRGDGDRGLPARRGRAHPGVAAGAALARLRSWAARWERGRWSRCWRCTSSARWPTSRR